MIGRRRFIVSMLGGAGCGFGWYLSRNGSDDRLRYTATSRALGAQVTLTVLHKNGEQARKAMALAFRRVEAVEEVMSLYRPHSQLVSLNQHGFIQNPHADFVQVLRIAQDLSARTEGAFDVTVQPLWELRAHQPAPWSDRELASACQRVDWRRLEVSPEIIRLGKGMAVTLNGIAQGFAADAVQKVLLANGVEDALIDTGEIGSIGRVSSDQPWRIGIRHPREKGRTIATLSLDGRAMATSGDYESTFTDNFTEHHLVDPTTGRSPNELASVTVAAPDSVQADALSTALYVMGPSRGVPFVESIAGVDAFFVRKNGERLATSGMKLQQLTKT